MSDSLARSFDRATLEYERGRPGWPEEAVRSLGLADCTEVLDLGAGTGKLTRLLVRAFARVIALEPLDAMREVLETVVPEAEAVAGAAEDIPLPADSVDAVFCAEAFHWFDGERSLAEIARVLRPRGRLVLMWNVPAGPTEPSIREAIDLLEERGRPERQVARYESGEWREAFAGAPFEELREAQFGNPQEVSADELVSFFASMSWIAGLPPDERGALLTDVRETLGAPRYRRFWRTELYWTRLSA